MHNYEFKSGFENPTAAMAAKPSLAPRALYQDVAERLREQIFNRELEPGSWIDEQRVSADYGISRTPLREALKVLAVEGLVTMKVRRGAYVTEMSADDVRQVYHLLALLESDAAGEVARHATESQLAQLRSLHERLEKQVRQREAFFATNEQFHMQLLAIGRQPLARADRGRPAQGDEAQSPPFVVQAGSDRRFARRAPADHEGAGGARRKGGDRADARSLRKRARSGLGLSRFGAGEGVASAQPTASARWRSSAAPSPRHALPCMQASVVGRSAASRCSRSAVSGACEK